MLVFITIQDEPSFASATMMERIDFMLLLYRLRSYRHTQITMTVGNPRLLQLSYESQSRGGFHQHVLLFMTNNNTVVSAEVTNESSDESVHDNNGNDNEDDRNDDENDVYEIVD